jgi:hypothetical protein
MSPSSYWSLTVFNSVGTLTFRAGSSLFTDEMHYHDSSVASQDTYAAASGLVPWQRYGTCPGIVAAPEQVCILNCGATLRHTLQSECKLTELAVYHPSRFSAHLLYARSTVTIASTHAFECVVTYEQERHELCAEDAVQRPLPQLRSTFRALALLSQDK